MNTDHRPVDRDDPRWLISALADGEVDADELRRAVAAWAGDDPAARDRWYAYHLIGDALRSDELAAMPAADRDFCRRLGERLDAEPRPAAAVVELGSRRRWRLAAPAAMAAGVLAAATALFVLRDVPPGGAVAPRLAAAPSPPSTGPATKATAGQGASVAPVGVAQAGRAMLRDAQLDRYLRAHREYGIAQPVSLPGGSARSIETVSIER